MSAGPDATSGPQPVDPREHLLERFERHWRQSGPPSLAPFLAEAAAQGDSSLRWELVLLDMEYRWSATWQDAAAEDRLGPRPGWRAYEGHFPQFGSVDQLPAEWIAEEYRLRGMHDQAGADRFLNQYPQHLQQLAELLPRISRELQVERGEVSPKPEEPPAWDPRAPLPCADYKLLDLLGAGGGGKVYRARQKSLERDVAVKALSKQRQADGAAVEHFLQEARVLGRLQHPGIVSVHGLGRFPGGGYFLVMDLIEGRDLQTCLREDGPYPAAAAVDLCLKIADAIGYAHAQGILHCDLKPANVQLNRDGEPRVTDFGMARLDQTDREPAGGRILGGTPAYMAPEQARGDSQAIGPATDVFGWGGILFATLTAQPPRAMPAGSSSIVELIRQPPRPLRQVCPEIAPALEEVCDQCLAPLPQDRPRSMTEAARRLRAALTAR